MSAQASLGNILIVDDDKAITDLLVLNLRSEGYAVETIDDANAVDMKNYPDTQLLLIDASEQIPSGLDTIRRLRQTSAGDRIGIIYYSRYDTESVLIDALDSGADDAICKPFSLRELMARIRAVLRRRAALWRRAAAAAPASDMMNLGDLRIDFERKSVSISDELISLSNTEYSILALLMRNINTYNSRIEIFRTIWTDGAGANERIVDTNISRLRKKLGEYGSYISNRSGLGYIISAEKK